MILTNCAACAAPLAHDAPRCVRCETRYCSATCQQDHWRRGHEQICELIHRGGNAEKYHAEQKYEEAVAAAVAKCADDTKGQTCYICMGPGDEEEGLVRGCSCRGENGFAHVSCLTQGAQVAVERGGAQKKFNLWYTCSLCEQQYHGVVACALGWACWKTYVGRPEADWHRGAAMTVLGSGLFDAKYHEDALSVQEAELSILRRLGAPLHLNLVTQSNLASTYQQLGRSEEALQIERDVYSGHLKLDGEEHAHTLLTATNYADSLKILGRFEEAKALLRKTIPIARRVLGESNTITFDMRWTCAVALFKDPGATLDDLREAVTTLEDAKRIARRVLGGSAHPTTAGIEKSLREARAALRARETPPSPSVSG